MSFNEPIVEGGRVPGFQGQREFRIILRTAPVSIESEIVGALKANRRSPLISFVPGSTTYQKPLF